MSGGCVFAPAGETWTAPGEAGEAGASLTTTGLCNASARQGKPGASGDRRPLMMP